MDSQNKEDMLKKVLALGAVTVVIVAFVTMNNQSSMQQASGLRSETAQNAIKSSVNYVNDLNSVNQTNYMPVDGETGLVEESVSGKTKVTYKKVSSGVTSIIGQNANDDTGLLTIVYDITATNGDAYVGMDSNEVNFSVEKLVANMPYKLPNLNGVIATLTSSTCSITINNNCIIHEGDTERFKLYTVIQLPNVGNFGLYRVTLEGFHWAKTDLAQLNITKVLMYPYKTNWIYLN